MNEQKQDHDKKENIQQALIDKQQVHITALSNENISLKQQNARALTDKDNLQKEVMRSSDYIVSI